MLIKEMNSLSHSWVFLPLLLLGSFPYYYNKCLRLINIQREKVWLGMVVHGCNPSTREAEVGGSQMEASLRYTARPFLKKKKKGFKGI
jgi:hypothetical protein